MKQQDLTVGPIGKKLILYFLPIAAGTLFQQLYNAADAVIVGKFVGTEALAAVGGSSAAISNLLVGFFVSLAGGVSVIAGQLCGAKDDLGLRRSTSTGIIFSLIGGLFLSIILYIFSPFFLRVLKTPEETMEGAVTYLRIISFGIIPFLLANVESGIIRASGDSRSPFIFLLVCCVTNIVLDLVMVAVFNLGISGAAYATVFAQLLNAILATLLLLKTKGACGIVPSDFKFDRKLFGNMMRIGIPAGLQGSMYSVSNIILQIAVNLLGTIVVASWALSGKVDGFYWSAVNAGGIAVMNFAAQNYGAGNMERVIKCNKISMKLFMGMTVIISAILLTVGKLALNLFTDDPEVVSTTYTIMLYFVPIYVTWTYIEIKSGIFRGVGDAFVPTAICALGIAVFRIIWIYTVYKMSPSLFTVSIVYPISWTLTDIAFFFYYRSGKWLNRKKKPEKIHIGGGV